MEIKINDTTSIKVSNAILSTSNGIDFVLSQHNNSPIVLNIVRNEPNNIGIKAPVSANNHIEKEETSKNTTDTSDVKTETEEPEFSKYLKDNITSDSVNYKEQQDIVINFETTDKDLVKAVSNIKQFVGLLAYASRKEFGNSLLYKMMIRMMNMKMGNKYEVHIKDLKSGKEGKYYV
jgi:hypothetical protein